MIEDLDSVANSKKVRGEECIYHMVIEFFTDELKMDENEVKDLRNFKATRKNVDDNDKVYLQFEDEKSYEYIHRKAIIC